MSAERPASSPALVTEAGTPAKVSNGAESAGSIEIAIEEGAPEYETPAAPRVARVGATTEAPVTVKAPESSSPGSGRVGGETTRKVRTKLTLKIPDDEVARPKAAAVAVSASAPPPPASVPPTTRSVPPAAARADSQAPTVAPSAASAAPPGPDPAAMIVTPMRIISIEPPPPSNTAPPPAPAAVTKSQFPPPRASAPVPAPGTTSAKEDSWTPYQPTVADRGAAQAPVQVPVPVIPPMPAAPRPPRASHPSFPPSATAAVAPLAPARAPSPSAPPAEKAPMPAAPPSATQQMPPAPATERRLPPMMDSARRVLDTHDSSDDIPIVTEGMESGDEPEPTTSPRIPVATTPPPPPPHGPVVVPAIPPNALTPVASSVHTAQTPPAQPVAPAAKEVPPAAAAKEIAHAPAPIAPTPPRVAAAMAAPQPPIDIKNLPPMRALAPTEPEGLEVHFEDEPVVTSPRSSEPEAEIAAEDLVSVESAPGPSPSQATQGLARDTTPRAFMPAGATAAAPGASKSIPPPPKSGAPSPTQAKATPRVIVPTAVASPLAPPAMTSDHATARRKARPWWEELFNDDFIRTMAKITDEQIAEEVDFIEESLAVAKGAMLLDLACGTGRHAIELTRRGYKVVGFDLSLPMLARAADEAQERAVKLNFVQGDMREMTFEDTFDGIYCWATSFGFFEEEKNALVVQKMHKALKKGGQLLLDVVNRDFIMRQAPSLAWFEGDGCVCMDEMSIDWITSRMKVKRTMMMDDGRTKEIDYSVRIYSLHELGKILHEAGFRVAEVSGRTATPGVFFGSESPRTMILAEKK